MDRQSDPVAALAEALAGNVGRAERERAFLRQVAAFGVSRFAYVNHTPLAQCRYLETNYPAAWVEHYTASNYHAVDVVYRHGRVSAVPFQWRNALAMPLYEAEARVVFDEAAEYGIHDGYCVPIHGPAGLAIMSMAVDDPALFGPAGKAQLQALHLMALHYHLSCERTLAMAQPAGIHLTDREREVLTWTAQGKTGWEIAQILNLTERTVTFHVENARQKLGASSRGHAAVKAMTLGLISV